MEQQAPKTEDRTFCESHWKSVEHGPETVRMDAFDRPCVFRPEGESCYFCPEPAAYRAPVELIEAESIPPDPADVSDTLKAELAAGLAAGERATTEPDASPKPE